MEHCFVFLTSYTGQSARDKHFYSLGLHEKSFLNLKMSIAVPEQCSRSPLGSICQRQSQPLLSLRYRQPPATPPCPAGTASAPCQPPAHLPKAHPAGTAGALACPADRALTPLW